MGVIYCRKIKRKEFLETQSIIFFIGIPKILGIKNLCKITMTYSIE